MQTTTPNIRILIMLILLLLGIAWIAMPTMVRAEEILDAMVSVDRNDATVGDPITLTINVIHPEGSHVIFPDWEDSWGDFIVREESPANTVKNSDGTLLTVKTLSISGFAPGIHMTPPTTLKLTDGAGNLSELQLNPVQIEILSVLVDGDQELRDIKPQARVPYTDPFVYLMVTGLAIAAAGVLGYFYFIKRRGLHTSLDTRLPHEIAFDTLEQIQKLGLPKKGLYKQHYSMLSDAMRTYIQASYDVPMVERTTTEIRRNLKGTLMTRDVIHRLLNFLSGSDLIKFSKYIPSQREALDAIDEARQIVEITARAIQVEDDDLQNPGGQIKYPRGQSQRHEVVL